MDGNINLAVLILSLASLAQFLLAFRHYIAGSMWDGYIALITALILAASGAYTSATKRRRRGRR